MPLIKVIMPLVLCCPSSAYFARPMLLFDASPNAIVQKHWCGTRKIDWLGEGKVPKPLPS